MGVPTSEVGYTSAMPRREGHEVRKGHVGHWIKKKQQICKYTGKGKRQHIKCHEGRGEGEVQFYSFFNVGARCGVCKATLQSIYRWELCCTHCIGKWLGLRGGLDGSGKTRPRWDFISEPSSP